MLRLLLVKLLGVMNFYFFLFKKNISRCNRGDDCEDVVQCMTWHSIAAAEWELQDAITATALMANEASEGTWLYVASCQGGRMQELDAKCRQAGSLRVQTHLHVHYASCGQIGRCRKERKKRKAARPGA